MKIFAAGIVTETNTFSPVPTALEDFAIERRRDQPGESSGQSAFDLYEIWGKPAEALGHTFIQSLMAYAAPSGTTLKSTYESLRDEILSDLESAMPVEVVLLMLHGAMVAQGYDGCEEDLIQRVRQITGPRSVIGVELDLHCHLRPALLANADLVITYKEFPHIDINERAREVLKLALATRLGQIRPKMAMFDCRMVGLYATTREPMRSFVDAMSEAEQRKGVLSISFGHGFPFADLPHVGAKVVAIADTDENLARSVAEEFGERIYQLRHTIGFESVSLPMDQALARATASNKVPVVVADQSDNPGGGAPGDATFALRWLLHNGAREVALGIFYDPEVVKIAKKAGRGATLNVRLGGKMGPHSGEPVDIEATVTALRENYLQELRQQSGDAVKYPAGDVVALHSNGIDIIVGTERCQCFAAAIFTDLGIDPKQRRVLVVKSTQHFHASFAPFAAEIIYMAAPGSTAPDPRLVRYRRLNPSSLYPWTDDPDPTNRRYASIR